MKEQEKPHFATANFERRKHPRFMINLPVEFWRVDQTRVRPGRTGDVSEGGLLLYVSEEIEVGQELKMTLFVDSGEEYKALKARGKVVWKDFRLDEEGLYRVGVNFSEISPEHLEILKGFLQNLLKIKGSTHPIIPNKLLSALDISRLTNEKGTPWFFLKP